MDTFDIPYTTKLEIVQRLLASIYGDNFEQKQQFMSTNISALRSTPATLLLTLDGFREVIYYIESLRINSD